MGRPGFLDIIVFLSGASVMTVELLATRLVAPYLGYTLFSWTAVIAVILGALSLGYHYGGTLADRSKDLRRILYVSVLVAGAFTIAIPLLSLLVLPLSAVLGTKYGPLLASLCLFAPPALFFGAVLPLAAKIKTKDAARIGSSVGDLYAISTIGSIIGTLLTGYVLIASLGIRSIFILTGLMLCAISLIGLLIDKSSGQKSRRNWFVVVLALIIMLACIIQSTPMSIFKADKIQLDKDSDYYRIMVLENNGTRLLVLDSDTHSGIYLNSSDFVFRYVDVAYDIISGRQPDSLLVIGLGGGTLPSKFAENGVKVDVVELDPAVVDVANEYFMMNGSVDVKIDDGRTFLSWAQRSGKRYDAVFVDVYNSHYSIPPHLTTVETARSIGSLLNDDGIVVVNVISTVDRERPGMLGAIVSTYREVFRHVYALPLGDNSSKIQNVIMVASDSELNEYANYSAEGIAGTILTDDYSPVDNIMADSFG